MSIRERPGDITILKVRERLFVGRVITSPDPHEDILAEWDFGRTETWPLTHWDSEVRNLRVEDGALKFALAAPRVTLGFGNFAFGENAPHKTLSFRGTQTGGVTIQIKRRQSKPVEAWRLDFRYHGDPKDAGVWVERGWGLQGLELAASDKTSQWETVSNTGCCQVAEADGIRSEKDRLDMGARGRRMVEEKHAWNTIAGSLIEVYEWILGRKGRPSCVLAD